MTKYSIILFVSLASMLLGYREGSQKQGRSLTTDPAIQAGAHMRLEFDPTSLPDISSLINFQYNMIKQKSVQQ